MSRARELTDYELDQQQKVITRRLLIACLGQKMTDSTVKHAEDIIATHRTALLTRGLNFPVLVPIVLPKNGTLDVVRAEQDTHSIETIVVNLTRKYPGVTPEDLAFGIGRAFPDHVRKVAAAAKNKNWTHH